MSTTIVMCRCESQFQDRRYGKQRRVANHTAKEEARCTVCSATHRVADAPRIKKKTGTGGGGSYLAIPPEGGWPGGPPEKNGWHP